MNFEQSNIGRQFTYRPNLDRTQEAVISSHFMHRVCSDSRLMPYGDDEFSERSVTIPASTVSERLLPILLRASTAFACNRASAAKYRAAKHCARYGLNDPHLLGPAEFIAEVMFDRQFRRGPRETYSRRVLRGEVAQRIAAGVCVEMVIPALPYKLSCPLKTRGQQPDLAEANFLLGLYEIAAAIEVLYREARPDLPGPLARFTVVSDGYRFNCLVNEQDEVIECYRRSLADWRDRLHLDKYIELLDYRTVLHAHLSAADLDAKDAHRAGALLLYAGVMWPIYNPCDMTATFGAASRLDPDPERANSDGRFVSLMKSLVFTVRYRSLERFRAWPRAQFCALYRELTAKIFEPFVNLSPAELRCLAEDLEKGDELPITEGVKEYLRRAMLDEAWSATIAYIAEIKSDRDLVNDPICACLPNHLRWTIHPKPGQLGLLTPAALGMQVQAWAGAAVFKRARAGGIRLCTVPVLALEGAGAIPVRIADGDAVLDQPLFYIYPDIAFTGIDEFITGLPTALVRNKSS